MPFREDERDQLIEHGDAEPAAVTPDSSGVSHTVRGPSDVTAALELSDRGYRDVRRRAALQLARLVLTLRATVG